MPRLTAPRYHTPMTAPTRDPYLDPYREAQQTHGTDFGVTLWASPESQQRRFEVFTEMCFFADKRVLDAGCSRGDFAAFLLKRNIPYARFVGVDGLEDVIRYARGRDLPRAEFHAGDLLAQPDLLRTGHPQIITISGTLNTMDEDHAFQLLEHAWNATREALIFNFLSDRTGPGAPPQEYPAHRLPTMRLIDWALDKSWSVQFRQDYFLHGHDATILCRKA